MGNNFIHLKRKTNWALALIVISITLLTLDTVSTTKYMEKNNQAWESQIKINQKVIKTLEATPSATPTPAVKGAATPVTQPTMYSLLNSARQARGLGTLAYNAKLTTGAQARAKDLFTKNQWSHDGMHEAMVAAGLPDGVYEENLAKGYSGNPMLIVNAWEASPTHAANMFNPACTVAGIGYYQTYTVLWLGVCGQ